jgi:hypothetical protein
MKRLCVICGLVLFWMGSASGQSASDQAQGTAPASETPPPKPVTPIYIPRYELSGGYNYRTYNPTGQNRIGLNGGYGSLEYNLLNRIGAEVEVSGAFKNQGINGDLSIYNVLVGPEVYPFKHHRRVTPWAHFLFGESFYRDDFPAYGGFPHAVSTDSVFSWEGGGGVDVVYKKHWEIRLIEFDYAPTKFLGSGTKTSYRGSFGVVYRFGEKK